ncbi:WGR domain-containing protein [Rhizobium sp. RU20A]|nr:WGR domain-containing protein [Rhizobium sp. RU20A]
MARFYQLSVETSLFGEPVLTRRWGRIGTRGRVVCEAFASREGALAALHDHETRKLRRGYRRRP